jgi:transposase IS204/IS1001/IS1096/IS1165 family protein
MGSGVPPSLRLFEGCDDEETPDGGRRYRPGRGVAGLGGLRVLEVVESTVDVIVTVETTADFTGCRRCGVLAEAQDRRPVHIRDLPCFGGPARLVWIKRRWRCPDADCDARTWTEHSDHVDAQAVLTRRVGAEACRQVGSTPVRWPSGPRVGGVNPEPGHRLAAG